MIGQTHALMFNLIEDKIMALKPRPRGIPIGTYEEIKDAAGKTKLKEKPKYKTLQQKYASKNRKRWKPAK